MRRKLHSCLSGYLSLGFRPSPLWSASDAEGSNWGQGQGLTGPSNEVVDTGLIITASVVALVVVAVQVEISNGSDLGVALLLLKLIIAVLRERERERERERKERERERERER